jgi:hypothetical protein
MLYKLDDIQIHHAPIMALVPLFCRTDHGGRSPLMRLIAFLTNAVYMAAASALPGLQRGKARVQPHWGPGPVGVSISIRLFALTDLCVPEHQLAKLAAIAALEDAAACERGVDRGSQRDKRTEFLVNCHR